MEMVSAVKERRMIFEGWPEAHIMLLLSFKA